MNKNVIQFISIRVYFRAGLTAQRPIKNPAQTYGTYATQIYQNETKTKKKKNKAVHTKTRYSSGLRFAAADAR